MIKKAIDEPASDANESANVHRALIKEGKNLAPPRVPVPDLPQSQSLLKAKAVNPPPPLYCESVSPGSRNLNDVIGHVLSFVGLRVQKDFYGSINCLCPRLAVPMHCPCWCA